MTGPEMYFENRSVSTGESVDEGDLRPNNTQVAKDGPKFPPPIMEVSDDVKQRFMIWLDEYVQALISDQLKKQSDWAEQEKGYRAYPGPTLDRPYVGASNETIPAIAMAVDPVHARLETGIFKQDPVFRFKPLKNSIVKYTDALAKWVDYYQRHKLKLYQLASPRILEGIKLGTCVFKTVYDRQAATIKTYDETWQVVTKEEVRFSGPRVFGVSIGDFLFPPLYQQLQDCPIVAERIRTTFNKLKVAEASGKLTNIDELKNSELRSRTQVEQARADASHHDTTQRYHEDIEIFEVWCDYDINDDGLPEHLVATYHKDSRTLLQLRYNWYFHQRKPYTVIPYTITNDSLYGIGLCEMIQPLQDLLTKWHRMATDNAYLANIRMFIVKRESQIETVPRLYSGRCFFVDDPRSDFIPFAGGDIYPSTLTERQNVFGIIEKRSGISDYLTGRESPIVGSRATATSTVALIQEGTKRVEQVLENFRNGFAEIIENCIYIWIQYGLEDLSDIVFGDDETGPLLEELFSSVLRAENVNGALAIDLSATDAASNRAVMQQMQLQLIQIMMGYLEKVLEAGASMMQVQQQMPEMANLIVDVTTAAKKMFRDLLNKYEVPNPDDYLVDLRKYLNAQPGQNEQGGASSAQGGAPGFAQPPALPLGGGASRGPVPGLPAIPGSGNGPAEAFSLIRGNGGPPQGSSSGG